MNLEYKFSTNDIIKQKRVTRENIESIEKWLLLNNTIYIPTKLQEELITLFLLSCDNNIELTKKTINSYFKLRKDSPDLFDGRKFDREDIQKALYTLRMVAIPVRTDNNYAVNYFRLHDLDYKNFDLLPIMKASLMLMDIHQIENPPQGIIYVVDVQGFGIKHLLRFTPGPLKRYFSYLGDGLPMKFIGMHFLNANYFVDKLLSMVRVLIKPEVMSRLQTHPPGFSIDEFTKLIPKKCLPKELEGDLPSEEILIKKTKELLKKRESFWDAEEKLRKSCF